MWLLTTRVLVCLSCVVSALAQTKASSARCPLTMEYLQSKAPSQAVANVKDRCQSSAQNTFCESCYCSVSYTAARTFGPQLSSMSAAEAQACGLSLSMTLVQLGALDLKSAAALSERCSGAIQRVVGSNVCSKYLPAANKSQTVTQSTGPSPSNTTAAQVATSQENPALASAPNSIAAPVPKPTAAAGNITSSATGAPSTANKLQTVAQSTSAAPSNITALQAATGQDNHAPGSAPQPTATQHVSGLAAAAPSTANRPQTAAQSTAPDLSNTTAAQVATSQEGPGQGAAPQPIAAPQPRATPHVSSPAAGAPGTANKSQVLVPGTSPAPSNTTAAQPTAGQGDPAQSTPKSTVSAVPRPTAKTHVGSPAAPKPIGLGHVGTPSLTTPKAASVANKTQSPDPTQPVGATVAGGRNRSAVPAAAVAATSLNSFAQGAVPRPGAAAVPKVVGPKPISNSSAKLNITAASTADTAGSPKTAPNEQAVTATLPAAAAHGTSNTTAQSLAPVHKPTTEQPRSAASAVPTASQQSPSTADNGSSQPSQSCPFSASDVTKADLSDIRTACDTSRWQGRDFCAACACSLMKLQSTMMPGSSPGRNANSKGNQTAGGKVQESATSADGQGATSAIQAAACEAEVTAAALDAGVLSSSSAELLGSDMCRYVSLQEKQAACQLNAETGPVESGNAAAAVPTVVTIALVALAAWTVL